MEDTDDIRRAGFVDSLLDSGSCLPVASADVKNDCDGGGLVQPETGEVVCDSYSQRSEGTLLANTGTCYHCTMIISSYGFLSLQDIYFEWNCSLYIDSTQLLSL